MDAASLAEAVERHGVVSGSARLVMPDGGRRIRLYGIRLGASVRLTDVPDGVRVECLDRGEDVPTPPGAGMTARVVRHLAA